MQDSVPRGLQLGLQQVLELTALLYMVSLDKLSMSCEWREGERIESAALGSKASSEAAYFPAEGSLVRKS